MNFLASIYCNQYFELKQKGKEASARYNGTILTSFALVLVLFALYIVLVTFVPEAEKEVQRFVRKTVGKTSGRMFGKILGLVFMIVAFVSIRFTYGTTKNYQKIIKTFNALSPETQQNISKKGLKVFVASIIFMGIALVTLLIKTYV